MKRTHPNPSVEDKLIRIPLAVEAVTGQRPSPAKCWRWHKRGVQGVRLQTWLVGGARLTSMAAVRAFIRERTEQDDAGQQPVKARVQPRRLDEATRQRLKQELGVDL